MSTEALTSWSDTCCAPHRKEQSRNKPGIKLKHSLALEGFTLVSMPIFLTKARTRVLERCKISCFVVPRPKNLPPNTETHWALTAAGGSDSPHLAAQGSSTLCQADPPASPCLQPMDSLTSKVLEMVYKTYITTKCDSVRVGTGCHIHTVCKAWISSFQRHFCTGIMTIKGAEPEEGGHWASSPSWMAKQWQPCSAAAMWFAGKHRWKNTPSTGGTSHSACLIAFTLNTGSCAPSTHHAQSKGRKHQQLCLTALSTVANARGEAHCTLFTRDNAAKVNGVLYQAPKHALRCMDWDLLLEAIPVIIAGNRDITREGTISITQAELVQEKLSSPKL